MKVLAHGFEPIVRSGISDLLAFDTSRSIYSQNQMLDVLLAMSIFGSCAEGTSNSLLHYRRCPSADTLLLYIKPLDRLELQSISCLMTENLVSMLRARGLLNKSLDIALDWHDDMYYGKRAEMVNGTKPARGSSYAYQYMTASVLVDGIRFVIYVMPVKSRGAMLDYVRDCIATISNRLGIAIASVCLDAGFFSEEMTGYLNSTGYRYVIRMPANRKIQKMRMKNGQWIQYELGGGTRTGLVCCDDSRGKRYYLATNMRSRPQKILAMYKRRWGIETSYRMVEDFMPQTTSKKYVVRLYYFLFAVWMYNLWVLFNLGQKGGHVIVLAVKMGMFLSIAQAVQEEG
ncbi:MAG: transposase [Nitrosotalea sp.]